MEFIIVILIPVLVAVAPSSNSRSSAAPTITELSRLWWLRKEECCYVKSGIVFVKSCTDAEIVIFAGCH
jgi:hypothetical protein